MRYEGVQAVHPLPSGLENSCRTVRQRHMLTCAVHSRITTSRQNDVTPSQPDTYFCLLRGQGHPLLHPTEEQGSGH